MSSTFKSVICAAAISSVLGVVSGCASVGGGSAAESGGGEPEYTGIQTKAIRAAPASQQARNESRPLSELNTPAAIAARESAPPPPRQAAPAAVARAAPAMASAPAAAPASAPAHQQIPALQKGAKVRAYGNASLRARPSASSDGTPVAPATELELGPQIYNADGYWWYVTAGKDSGWLLQADIQR